VTQTGGLPNRDARSATSGPTFQLAETPFHRDSETESDRASGEGVGS
jgi:hypothetical protein